jgi:hypothetical protein
MKRASELESWCNASNLIKESVFQELVKQGMDENVAKGVSDEMEPSYMDLWSKLLTEPNGSYMDIPLDADELRKVASYIEELEKAAEEVELAPRQPLIEKMARLGISREEALNLKTPSLEKIASMAGSDNDAVTDFGVAANRSGAANRDPMLDFLLG